MGTVAVAMSEQPRKQRRMPSPGRGLGPDQLFLPLELAPKSDLAPATVNAVDDRGHVERNIPARQEAGGAEQMADEDQLPTLLDALSELTESADATSAEAQSYIEARNRLVVAAHQNGATRRQLAQLMGVAESNVSVMLERAKGNEA